MAAIEIDDKIADALDSIRSSMGITWNELFANIVQRPDELRGLATPIGITEQLRRNTISTMLRSWTANLRDNMEAINASGDIITLPKGTGRPVLCMGAGPSLDLHLDEINEFKGKKLAVERVLIPLLEHGIVPDYVCSLDREDVMIRYIDHPLVDKHADEMIGVFGTTISPSFVSRWPGEKVFFNPWIDNPTEMSSVSLVYQVLNRKSIMHTGANSGSALWFLSTSWLQASPIVLLGIDFAYRNDTDYSETLVWHDIKHLPKEEQEKHYYYETNPFGRATMSELIWISFRDALLSWIKGTPGHETIQCSDYTILYQEPLKVVPFKEYLDGQK